ncbi:MMPL family transporter [Capillimicrobium parvum]|uniref:Membrane transport protein MMPL domain-containing protein n=1 Tax=Capillimicrobium parvum TaxID=2884022 RepID=A0A9E6XXI9_9ACTN|nr:MMPL family transporter [Capillimicrobium parvum]UGS36274.1 hypothetical protein DSM104329_02675 [Capillimicrobium parvum]
MLRLAKTSIRHPVVALLICIVFAGGLIAISSGITSSVSPSIVVVPGTDSSHAQHLAEAEFGPSVLVPILLEGPKAQLDRQGPALVRELALRRDTRVMSAWDGGEVGAGLRPRPTAAMIVASVAHTEKEMVKTYQAQIDGVVAKQIGGPVHASITGQPSLDRGFKDAAIDATRTGALLTIPILFVVLLLLLRAPVAAAGLALLGGVTALSGLGLMTLLGKVMPVDSIAMALGTMTGLALAVGYGLLVFRRWRQEVDRDVAHHDAAHAAVGTVASTGRAVLVGGTGVVLSLVVAAAIAPTEILTSLGIGAMLCALLAVGGAVVVVPAALTLLGHRALWLSFPAPRPLSAAWDRLATGGGGSVVRHAGTAGMLATALLVALALPIFSLQTGPPGAQLLPTGSPERQSFERVAQVMGPGWPTPFNIVIAAKDRPITDQKLLAQIETFQKQLVKDERVASVVGPGSLAPVSRELGVLPKELKSSTKLLKGGKKKLGELQSGLDDAAAGSQQLQQGLSSAANGAGQLQSGAGQARSGAGQLRNGLGQARSGAAQISGGLGQALDAAQQLRDGAAKLLAGSKQLKGGLGQAVTPVQQGLPIVKQMAADVSSGAEAVKAAQGTSQALIGQLDQAAAQLQGLPADDPAVQSAQAAVQSARQAAEGTAASLNTAAPKISGAAGVAGAFATQVGELSTGLAQLYAGSTQLTDGITQLQAGNSQLAAGIGKLNTGGGRLTDGVTALRDGASRLESGLGQLTTGAGQLAGGLSSGTGPAGRLASGLAGGAQQVAKFRGDLPSPKDLERLMKESPGLFDSGYFVLAAVSGAQPAARNQASFAVNLDRGGSAGQIVVISRTDASSDATRNLGEDLQARVDAFTKATRTEGAVGGPAGQLGDFTTATASRILPVAVALAVIMSLLLMAFLRAIAVPLAAVALDLLTCAATFGAMQLLFGGGNPLLGGPGYVDPMSIIAILAAVFGITMVYEVHLLWRTREKLLASGDPDASIRLALRETAGAGTGAAIAMVAAIVPFAISQLVVVRQLGVGVAVAIVLDGLIVRPVLLPAALEVLGRWGWWPTSRRAPAPPPAAPAEPDRPAREPETRPIAGARA